MVTAVRIYVEGGGQGKDTKAQLRKGFHTFLKELVEIARSKRVQWQIIACGSREDTFRNFNLALQTHLNAFNVLLVDSESPLATQSPWLHLQQQDNWHVAQLSDEHCHLMVQAMECWIVADGAALKGFYGQGFREKALPKRDDLESVSKATLAAALKKATQQTKNGAYHKTRHAPKLLESIDANQVQQACRQCDRLFATLKQLMS